MIDFREKLLILGVGNLIMGDEGVGVHVVQRLEKRSLPDTVICMDGGTGGFLLMEPMQRAKRIILIDAAAFDDPPGSLHVLTPKYGKEYPQPLTVHDLGVKDLLDSLQLLGVQPDIHMIAITINPEQSIGIGLSPAVAAAALQAEQLAMQCVESFIRDNVPDH